MSRFTASFLAIVLFLGVQAVSSSAQEPEALRGVALVIGQSEYENLSQLPNAGNDADAIEALLSELGFDSVRRTDRNASTLARDLERFVEDAEDADVAILYYSGHGIEAGGENWLVPVDADLTALDDAGAQLVPVSATIERLKATVPVAIVMLDACRDNPFPPGSLLRPAPGAEAVAVSQAGLGLSRSAASLIDGAQPQASAPDANVGTVVAFAAEPGKVALDGTAGGNSPYTSAVLRHFDAMAGEEFGMVMRMVAEEVYLKTGGRQRPWINESLRRLLYFGQRPDAVEGPEGDILRERRQLLVTISALPDPERRSIEKVANDGGLPMDAVYGMLRALGTDAPSDPAELEALLRQQTDRIKQLQAERATIQSTDPQIARLSELSEQAILEGALETAVEINRQAKERVVEIEGAVQDAEADIKARRIEFAEVYARSGKTAYMTFDYDQSVADYEQAFRQVERWDDWSAWSYRGNQAVAVQAIGWRTGQTPRLFEALDLAREIVRLSERLPGHQEWALSQVFLGNTLLSLGQRLDDVKLLREAIATYEAALAVIGEDESAYEIDQHEILYNIAGASQQIAYRDRDQADLADVAENFARLAEQAGRDIDPERWARAKSSEAAVIIDMSRELKDAAGMARARDIVSDLIEIRQTLGTVDELSHYRRQYAIALSEIGIMKSDETLILEAQRQFDDVLPSIDRAASPVVWSSAYYQRAINGHQLYLKTNDPVWLERSTEDYRTAISVRDRTAMPRDWADAMAGIAGTTMDLGRHHKDVAKVLEGREKYIEARAALDPATDPDEWLRYGWLATDGLRSQAEIEPDTALLDAALDEVVDILSEARRLEKADVSTVLGRVSVIAHAYATITGKVDEAAVLAGIDRCAALLADGQSPEALAGVESARGRALYVVAINAKDTATMHRSVEAYRAALGQSTSDRSSGERSVGGQDSGDEASDQIGEEEPTTLANLALALMELGRMEKTPAYLSEAIDLWRRAQENQPVLSLWTSNQSQLAIALEQQGTAQSYAEAIEAWSALLDRIGPDAPAVQRAEFLDLRGRSLHNLAAFDADPEIIVKARADAIADYRAAIAAYGTEKAAATSNILENLADLLKLEGELANDPAQLREASELYGRTLEGPARTDDAVMRRRIQLKQAGTLTGLAFAASDNGIYAQAIERFEQAFGPAVQPADVEADWSLAAIYGNALRLSGQQARDAALLKRSAQVLETVSSTAGPTLDGPDRAWLDYGLAETLTYLGEIARDRQASLKSVALWREVVAHYTPEAYPDGWRGPLAGYAMALSSLGDVGDDADALVEAANTYARLLSATDKATEPSLWADYANGRAYAIANKARRERSSLGELEEAASIARQARAIMAEHHPPSVPHVEDTLCSVMIEQGRLSRNRIRIEEGLGTCELSLKAFKETGSAMSAHVEKNIARGKSALQAMP